MSIHPAVLAFNYPVPNHPCVNFFISFCFYWKGHILLRPSSVFMIWYYKWLTCSANTLLVVLEFLHVMRNIVSHFECTLARTCILSDAWILFLPSAIWKLGFWSISLVHGYTNILDVHVFVYWQLIISRKRKKLFFIFLICYSPFSWSIIFKAITLWRAV